ncbi:hypothetical protein FACS1894124_0890 [Spirochaetia bacterium]|nr:hypothetical protein FACS1894124_0890 [Spirochaetia bacterium]
MNKKSIFPVTLVMVLVLGLALVGCKTDADDDGGGGGGVPSELVGKWYSKAADTVLVFEITSANKLIMSSVSYDASVSGKTVTMSISGVAGGTFDYSISGSEMTITNGTGGAASMPALSPLIKK